MPEVELVGVEVRDRVVHGRLAEHRARGDGPARERVRPVLAAQSLPGERDGRRWRCRRPRRSGRRSCAGTRRPRPRCRSRGPRPRRARSAGARRPRRGRRRRARSRRRRDARPSTTPSLRLDALDHASGCGCGRRSRSCRSAKQVPSSSPSAMREGDRVALEDRDLVAEGARGRRDLHPDPARADEDDPAPTSPRSLRADRMLSSTVRR